MCGGRRIDGSRVAEEHDDLQHESPEEQSEGAHDLPPRFFSPEHNDQRRRCRKHVGDPHEVTVHVEVLHTRHEEIHPDSAR